MIDQKKAQSFADKAGVTIANRFAATIGEALVGYPEAEDAEDFIHQAVLRVSGQMEDAFYLAVRKALEVHQAREV